MVKTLLKGTGAVRKILTTVYDRFLGQIDPGLAGSLKVERVDLNALCAS